MFHRSATCKSVALPEMPSSHPTVRYHPEDESHKENNNYGLEQEKGDSI